MLPHLSLSLHLHKKIEPTVDFVSLNFDEKLSTYIFGTRGFIWIPTDQLILTSKIFFWYFIIYYFQDFKVDTFEYRLLREVSFRESSTKRYAGEHDSQIITTPSQGPIKAPQVVQKARSSKLSEGVDAVFSTKVSANPKPRVSRLQ